MEICGGVAWAGELCLQTAYKVATYQSFCVDKKLLLWPLRGTLALMKSGRIPVHISFPTAKDRDEAIRKSKARGRSLSGQIHWYFKTLPEVGTGSDVAGENS